MKDESGNTIMKRSFVTLSQPSVFSFQPFLKHFYRPVLCDSVTEGREFYG